MTRGGPTSATANANTNPIDYKKAAGLALATAATSSCGADRVLYDRLDPSHNNQKEENSSEDTIDQLIMRSNSRGAYESNATHRNFFAEVLAKQTSEHNTSYMQEGERGERVLDLAGRPWKWAQSSSSNPGRAAP
jgi:hypothetical protein